MGTTTSTNLALIKPDTDESIQENLPSFAGWAAQNALNCDKIDSLFRATTHTWTVSWTASTSNPTLGTGGFTEGKYIRLTPRMAIGYFRIFAGTTSFAGGTGFYRINLPVAIDPLFLTLDAQYTSLGKAVFQDSSAVLNSSAFTVHYFASTNHLIFRAPIGNSWGNVDPVAIGQSDRLSGYVMIPTADA